MDYALWKKHLPAKKSFTKGGYIHAALLNALWQFIINA
jgi:hypothetical protein